MKPGRTLGWLLVVAVCGACSGGDGGAGAAGSSASGSTTSTGVGGTGATTDSTLPVDTSREGLTTWLATASYRSAPWTGDPEVRAPEMFSGAPHGDHIRAYHNPTAIASITGGRNVNRIEGLGNDIGSAGVKEFYDEAGTQVGVAMFFRTALEGALGDWTYYCRSSVGLCTPFPEETDLYGAGAGECAYCHGGVFLSPTAQAIGQP